MSTELPALFVLADEYAAAAHALAQTDLDDETVRDTLEGLAGDLETKSTNVAMFVRNLEAVAEKMAEAEASIAARRKAIEKRAAKVREYLKENMEKATMTKIECPYLALTIKKNPPAVEVLDGVEVGLEEPFPGGFMNPPIHVSCRCAVSLKFS